MLTYEFVVYLAKMSVLLLAAVSLAFVVLDLLLGAVLLKLAGRLRVLWWLVPLNWIAWFVAALWLPASVKVGDSEISTRPWADLLAIPLVTLCAAAGAGLLLSIRLMISTFRARGSTETGPPALPERFNRPVSKAGLAGLIAGLNAPWEGLVYLSYYPWLWRYGIVPVLLNLIITALVFFGLIMAVFSSFSYIDGWFPEGWFYAILKVLTGLGFVLLAIGGALVSWLILQVALCGYFYGLLARQVELQLGTPPEELREASLFAEVKDVTIDIAVLIVINLGLLLLNLIPAVGSVLALVGGFYFNSFVLGREFFDYPLALRGWRRPEKLAFARERRANTCGLGLAVMGLYLVPFVGAVFLTTAVAGSVLLHRRIR